MSKDKTRLILITILTATVLIGVILYILTMTDKEKESPGSILSLSIPLILVIFMVFFIFRRYKDIKNGMPFEDERSKQVMTRAAATSFYVSLYWLLAISWFEPFFAKMWSVEKLDASLTTGGGITGMAVCFFVLWIYYDRKGRLI